MCASYSLQWSESVLDRFMERHGRATTFLCNLYGLLEKDVIRWIATNSPKWPRFKRGAKYVEKTYHSVEKWSEYDYETLVKYYRRTLGKRFLDSLDEPVDTDCGQMLLSESTQKRRGPREVPGIAPDL